MDNVIQEYVLSLEAFKLFWGFSTFVLCLSLLWSPTAAFLMFVLILIMGLFCFQPSLGWVWASLAVAAAGVAIMVDKEKVRKEEEKSRKEEQKWREENFEGF